MSQVSSIQANAIQSHIAEPSQNSHTAPETVTYGGTTLSQHHDPRRAENISMFLLAMSVGVFILGAAIEPVSTVATRTLSMLGFSIALGAIGIAALDKAPVKELGFKLGHGLFMGGTILSGMAAASTTPAIAGSTLIGAGAVGITAGAACMFGPPAYQEFKKGISATRQWLLPAGSIELENVMVQQNVAAQRY